MGLRPLGERVLVRSEDGDLPENIEEDIVYYIIKSPGSTQFKLASSTFIG